MEQHDTRSCGITAIDVVQKHAVASEEFADGRVLPLRQLGENDVPDDEKHQQQDRDEQYGFKGGHFEALMTRSRLRSRAAGDEPVRRIIGS